MVRFLPELGSKRLLYPAAIIQKLSTSIGPVVVLQASARKPTGGTSTRTGEGFNIAPAFWRSIDG
jgi:hypothetical protein